MITVSTKIFLTRDNTFISKKTISNILRSWRNFHKSNPNLFYYNVVEIFLIAIKKKGKKIWTNQIHEGWKSLYINLMNELKSAITKRQETTIISTGLTDGEKGMIQQSWNLLSKVEFTKILYKKIFELAPHVRCLFQNSIESQHENFSIMMDMMINEHINDELDLFAVVLQLAKRHFHYKVKTDYYSIFRDGFLWSLEQTLSIETLNKTITNESTNQPTTLKSIWLKFVNYLISVMVIPGNDCCPMSNDNLSIITSRLDAATLYNATELNLCNYKVLNFPSRIGDLIFLQKLIVRNNNFTKIPESIATLTNLVELDLSNNKIKVITTEISHLINLGKLYFSFNSIRKIPSFLCHLKKLKKLSINDNKVDSILPNIYLLDQLEFLDVSNNRIKQFPWQLSLCNPSLVFEYSGNPLKLSLIQLVSNNGQPNIAVGSSSSYSSLSSFLGNYANSSPNLNERHNSNISASSGSYIVPNSSNNNLVHPINNSANAIPNGNILNMLFPSESNDVYPSTIKLAFLGSEGAGKTVRIFFYNFLIFLSRPIFFHFALF